MAFAVLFVVQLAAAPVRQRNELRAAWDTGEPVRAIDIELTLRNERRKVSGFYRVKPRGSGIFQTRENEQEAEEWTNRIVSLLSEHVSEDAAREFVEAPAALRDSKPNSTLKRLRSIESSTGWGRRPILLGGRQQKTALVEFQIFKG